MQRYAIINSSTNAILNVIEYDNPPGDPPPGFDAPVIAIQHDSVGPNWTFDGTTFSAPPEPPALVVTQVSSRQFWTQMAIQGLIDESEAVDALGGKIPNDIKQFINGLPLNQRFPARMFFEAPTFERHGRAATDLQACFSLSNAAVDLFFKNAAAL